MPLKAEMAGNFRVASVDSAVTFRRTTRSLRPNSAIFVGSAEPTAPYMSEPNITTNRVTKPNRKAQSQALTYKRFPLFGDGSFQPSVVSAMAEVYKAEMIGPLFGFGIGLYGLEPWPRELSPCQHIRGQIDYDK